MKNIRNFLTGLVVIICPIVYLNVYAQNGSALGRGIEGTVVSTIEFNGELYAGGQFAKAGNVDAINVAKWDGKKWTSLASGLNGSVYSFCVFNEELYAGGNFTMSGTDSISHIARWNGKVWMPVGKGVNGRINAMIVFKNELYVGGMFDKAGAVSTSNIAKWNGKDWSVVGTAIAKWNNNTWDVVGSGTNGRVSAFCIYNGILYVSGRFTYAGVTPANYIAKWDGTNWSAVETGLSVNTTAEPFANALAIYNSELYIGGFFNSAGGVASNNIVKWNGVSFQPVGTGLEYSSTGEIFVRSLFVYKGELYVGGIFNSAGSIPTTNIAKWNGKAWLPVDFKNTQINCFSEYKGSLITGGIFKGILGEPNNIASFCPYISADFTMTPPFGKKQPLEVKFTNNSMKTGSDSYTTSWDFGDETTSDETDPVHIFKQYGNIPVMLFVTAKEGCTSLKLKYVTIDSMPPPKPTVNEYKNVISLDNPQPNEKYQWFFNNNNIWGATSSKYTATKTGKYHLVVSNAYGSSKSEQINVVVVDNAKIANENLDINNITARFNSEGSMFWDFIDPIYEVPKGSDKSTIYTGTLWLGGYDGEHKLHVAAQTYRRKGTDFWAGPVMNTDSYSAIQDTIWNMVWKVSKQEIEYHKAHWQEHSYKIPKAIDRWPGNGDLNLGQARNLAPYVDNNNNGLYDPINGDYPLIKGEQCVFFIFNDDRAKHTETQGVNMGVEIQGMAYAFNSPKDSALNNTVFVNYKITNRSKELYDSVYVGVFTDFDIGMSTDDYIGCDPNLNAYFGYNGDDYDEGTYGYGQTPPAQGVVFLDEVMTNFMYFNNSGTGTTLIQNPDNAEQYYNYLRSIWKDKSHATYDGIGYGGKTPSDYMFSGWYGGWTEGSVGIQPADRRGIGSFGPFSLGPNESKSFNLAYITASDYSGNMLSVDLLKQRIVKIKEYYKTKITGK